MFLFNHREEKTLLSTAQYLKALLTASSLMKQKRGKFEFDSVLGNSPGVFLVLACLGFFSFSFNAVRENQQSSLGVFFF